MLDFKYIYIHVFTLRLLARITVVCCTLRIPQAAKGLEEVKTRLDQHACPCSYFMFRLLRWYSRATLYSVDCSRGDVLASIHRCMSSVNLA